MLGTKRRFGAAGEELAAEHLRLRGWEVVARNFRTRSGEIDLVCTRAGEAALVEVKTRAGSSHGLPIEAIDTPKLERMQRCAAEWRRASEWRGPTRCLVVTISLEVLSEL